MALDSEVAANGVEELLLRSRVENFLFHEARLLDERDFTAWLALFAQDGTYWVPGVHDHADPMEEVSIVYDRISMLRERVWRLESGLAYAQEPPSRTVHVLGNVEIPGQGGDEITVRSNLVVAEFRRERQLVYAGRCLHRLRSTGEGFVITLKKVCLVNNDGHLGNLSFLL